MQPFVYFDLGMVLVRFDHQVAIEQLANVTGCSAEQIRELAFTSGLQERYETGLVSSEAYVAEINETLQLDLGKTEVLEAISAIFEPPREEILEVLELLRSREIPMAILSNTCEAHWEWIQRQDWKIPGDWFEFHILSYEVQSMKPDGKIYEVCENEAQRPASQLFFTDDRLENVEAAQARGWQTHLFENEQDLTTSLLRWLATFPELGIEPRK